mgnify:CR=1 FL=1
MEGALNNKEPKKVKLDQIDQRILHDLQADGRITNVKLAENAGISAPPCLRRVRALEDDGFILGYHAEIDPPRLDFKEMFFALVGLVVNLLGDMMYVVIDPRIDFERREV